MTTGTLVRNRYCPPFVGIIVRDIFSNSGIVTVHWFHDNKTNAYSNYLDVSIAILEKVPEEEIAMWVLSGKYEREREYFDF